MATFPQIGLIRSEFLKKSGKLLKNGNSSKSSSKFSIYLLFDLHYNNCYNAETLTNKEAQLFFEKFAKDRNFDPLVALNWYHISIKQVLMVIILIINEIDTNT